MLRFAVVPLVLVLVPFASAQNGSALYNDACAQCHDRGVERAPQRDVLRAMTAERVLAALESGPMISVTIRRTAAERRAIAEFAAGKPLGQAVDLLPPPEAMCKTPASSAVLAGPQWTGWGAGTSNTRFQDAKAAGLTAADIPKLKLKWAFAFPTDLNSFAQSTVSGGRVFIGSQTGIVYSLNASTGCVNWYFQATSWVRGAFSFGKVGADEAVFFGDGAAWAYAVNAQTGRQIWKTKLDDFPVARSTGSPALYNGKIFYGVASNEEASGGSPDYQCCKFRGSLVALDAASGKVLWKTYTVDAPKPTKKNKKGTQLFGPSGAPIWSSPAIDPKRNAVYATTGDNYSDPPSRTSDAFMAFDMNTGKVLWSRQMTPKDSYNVACRMPDTTNCPDNNGPDLDFAAAPILLDLPNGKRVLVAGQKSGVVHALDPDQQGELLWSTRIGHGGSMGGVQWGSASDGSNIYVALSDIGRVRLSYSQATDADPKVGGGMYALRLSDGKQVWKVEPEPCPATRARCSPAQSAAVSAIPGVAFQGSLDGHLRAYSTTDGKVVWDFDTERTYETVNKVPGRGGSMDGPGPSIAGGMVFVNSGYASGGGAPGNVLLAFSVDGK